MTNLSGAAVNTNSYSAFGLGQAGGGAGKVSNDHLFAGEQLDPTGLYFNRARYYSPSLGRFIGRDSVSGDDTNPTAQNRYIYGWDNPILQTDPAGNTPLDKVSKEENKQFPKILFNYFPQPLDPICIGRGYDGYIIESNLSLLQCWNNGPSLSENGVKPYIDDNKGISIGMSSIIFTQPCINIPTIIWLPNPIKQPLEIIAAKPHDKGNNKWTCYARCHCVNYSGVPKAPTMVTGKGYGTTETDAATNAIADAQANAPLGTYTRHCHTTVCYKD